MKSVKTNELKVGDWAAHIMDLPGFNGIEVSKQGYIDKVHHTDMWGVPSETHTTVVIRERDAAMWDTQMYMVHNTHTWIVR